MKTKVLLLLIFVSLLTASFTFTKVKPNLAGETKAGLNIHQEPLGGFVSEDKL